MKLYNTLTRSIEELSPLTATKVGLYACGPTVYDYAHLGHLRKYTMDDLLVRVLRAQGLTVTHVQNITDVGHLVSDGDTGEDKMEKGAKKYGKTVWEISAEFEAFFWKSLDQLGVNRPDISCKATDHIPEQITLITRLEKKGYTYTLEDGVYFDTSKFPDYGSLAHLNVEELKAGARVEMVAGKKQATDFALWKFSPATEQRQMEWDSPWGKGFPGWHIECSAMAMKYLGEQFDIHTGGIDHIPVHHTNEIAQAEAATGKHPFVRFWVHHNFLRVEGEKMSKSLGNFFTIDDVIAKGFSPMALKLLFYTSHYRSELNFTWKNLEASKTALQRLVAILSGITGQSDRDSLSEEKMEKISSYKTRFFDALDQDLDTPQAIAIVWEVLKSNIPGRDKVDLIEEFDSVLGLGIASLVAAYQQQLVSIPDSVKKLLEQRQAARLAKDFATSDALRDQIATLGFIVQDSPEGQFIAATVPPQGS